MSEGENYSKVSEQSTSPEHHRDPFEGIDYFKKYDRQEMKVVEDGTRDKGDWIRAEYYPGKGCYRILYTDNEGKIRIWHHNLRRPLIDQFNQYGDLKSKVCIQRGKDLLASIGVKPEFTENHGYPELTDFVKRAEELPEADIRNLAPGNYYSIISARPNTKSLDIGMFRYSHTETDPQSDVYDTKLVKAFPQRDEKFDYRFGVNATTGGVWDIKIQENVPSAVFFFNKDTNQRVINDWEPTARIVPLSLEDLDRLMEIMPPDYDPLVEAGITREEFAIYCAIQGLQYARWAKYDSTRSMTVDYSDTEKAQYGQALDKIIARFGSEQFASTIQDILETHLYSLHTSHMTPKLRHKPHSDITPLGANEMRLAKQIIDNVHPLSQDMGESGNAVNVLPLFGDKDFWVHIKNKYPALFGRFVDYLLSLPKQYYIENSYAQSEIDPVGVIKKIFPDSFQIIHQARNEFDSDSENPIKVSVS